MVQNVGKVKWWLCGVKSEELTQDYFKMIFRSKCQSTVGKLEVKISIA